MQVTQLKNGAVRDPRLASRNRMRAAQADDEAAARYASLAERNPSL